MTDPYDTEANQIPPMDTWVSLTQNQQLELLNRLENQLYFYTGKPEYTNMLGKGIAYLRTLLFGKP